MLELYIHLADVLSVKAGMGNRLCAAYAAGDKAALKEIAEKEIPSCMEKIKEYKRCREEIWDSESKISAMRCWISVWEDCCPVWKQRSAG